MAQQDFAGSRLHQAATTGAEEQDRAGPFDVFQSVPDFAVSDWMLIVIAIELGLIYTEVR